MSYDRNVLIASGEWRDEWEGEHAQTGTGREDPERRAIREHNFVQGAQRAIGPLENIPCLIVFAPPHAVKSCDFPVPSRVAKVVT